MTTYGVQLELLPFRYFSLAGGYTCWFQESMQRGMTIMFSKKQE